MKIILDEDYMMNNKYISKAKLWFERGKEEEDIFIKFILFYISFEVFVKVENLNKYKLNKDIENKIFNQIDFNIIQDLKKILDKNPLKNMQNKSKPPVKLDKIYDFENILNFIRVGRNNLFHGDKGLDIERDRMIVSFGCQILEKIIESINK